MKRHAFVPFVLGGALAACTGSIPSRSSGAPGDGAGGASSPGTRGGGGGSARPDVPLACNGPDRGATPRRLWRLTPAQYTNTVAALFRHGASGKATPPSFASPLVSAKTPALFSNVAKDVSVTSLEFETGMNAAQDLGAELVKRLRAGTLASGSCFTTVTNASFAACLTTTVRDLGAVLFRRPLGDDEVKTFVAVGTGGLDALGLDDAAAATFQALLLAPSTLFRVELGAGKPDASGALRLDAFELAAALSYTLTDAPPDDALAAQAKSGELLGAGAVRAQVARLTGDDFAGAPGVGRFFREYFEYEQAPAAFKDPKTYPFHDAASLVAATDRLVADTLQSSGKSGFWRALLTRESAFVSRAVATNYDRDPTSLGAELTKLPLAGTRHGILTEPSWLVTFSRPESTNPVKRGRFVRENLLCGTVPAIPIDQVPPLPDLGPNATERERMQVHSKGTCLNCHKLMDPIGLGFEDYDLVGRHRTTEQGKPVDASGQLDGAGPADGSFHGAAELADKLVSSATVEGCFVKHSFRFWLGRDEADDDACSLAAMDDGFRRADGGDYVDLLAAVFESRAFQYRKAP